MDEKTRLALPFDQYSRQVQVVEIIDALRGPGQSFKILDVGGYRGATSLLHPLDSVTVLDVFEISEPDYVKGNALAMAFADGSFDFVVSFDVFEHIANKDRKKFIAEVSRVASIAAIVAAPVKTDENETSEKMMNSLYKSMHDTDHPWLVEHIDNGLPELGQAESEMRQNGLSTLVLPSNDLQLWLSMQGAIFLGSKFPEMAAQIDGLNSSYNALGPFDGSVDGTQNYRNVVVGFHAGKHLKTIKSAIPTTSISLATKIAAQQEVTKAYLAAFQAMANNNEALAEKATGFEHACKVLSDDIHALQTEIVILKQTKGHKIANHLSKVKRTVSRTKENEVDGETDRSDKDN